MVTGLLSAYALPGRGGLAAAEFTLVAAEVTLTATGRRSDVRLRADDGGRERHFCPISYNKVKNGQIVKFIPIIMFTFAIATTPAHSQSVTA